MLQEAGVALSKRAGHACLLSVALAASALSSTTRAVADTFVFNHILEPSQEVPPTPSNATGECTVTLDDIARTLDVDCTYAGLTGQATAAHVHLAPPGVNGPPILTLNHTGGTRGTGAGFGILLPEQIQAVLDGNTYINVHSTAFQGGEIRGQIVDQTPPEPQSLHFGGLLHEALGQAHIKDPDDDGDGIPDSLVISNIGSSGNDGVRIALNSFGTCDSDASCGNLIRGWTGEIDFGEAGNLPSGMMLNINAPVGIDGGDGVDTIVVVTATDGGNAALTLAPNCPDCQINIKAWSNGVLVADMNRDGALDVVLTGDFGTGVGADGLPVPMRISHHRENPHYTTFVGRTHFFQGTGVSGMGAGQMIEADTILVTSNHPNVVMFIGAVEITAANASNITIRDEAVIAADIQARVRAAGAAQLVGAEVSDPDNDPCCGLTVSNIGSSGEDGVTFGPDSDASSGGLPTELDALAGSVKPGLKTRFDPIVLDLDGDGIQIKNSWCPNGSEQGVDCGGPLGMSLSLVGTGGGALAVSADFSELNTNEMIVSIHDSKGKSPVAPFFAVTIATNITVASLPNSSVQIESLTDASHAFGQHAPALIVGFAEPVSISIDGVGIFQGDELRIAPGNGDGEMKFTQKGKNRTSITGGGPGLETIHITDLAPAQVSFTQGHVFGFHHTATDGATMAIAPPMPNIPFPLTLESDTCTGTLSIDLGDAAEGFGFTQRVKDEVGTLKGSMKLFSVTGQPSPVGAQLAYGPCPPPPDEDPLCDGVSPALDDPGYFVVDLSELGATSYSIQAVQHPDVIVADVQANPPQMARILHSGHGGSLTVSGDLIVSSALAGAEFTDGRYVLRSGTPMSVQLPDNSIVVAEEVRITAHGIEEELTLQPVLSFECSPEVDDEVLAIIVDEWVELFDLEHRADGVAQMIAACCLDPDDDGDDVLGLVLRNPTGGLSQDNLTSASAATLKSTPQAFNESKMAVIQNIRAAIPDPCAGKPEPCEALEDGATLISSAALALDDGGTGHLDMTITPIECSDEGVANHYRGGLLDFGFSGAGSATPTVEVLLGGAVVATIPDYADPVAMCCPNCGHNENWTFDISHAIIDPPIKDGDVQSEIAWGSQRLFKFEIPQGERQEYIGDTLRFTTLSVEGVSGTINHSVTTINIPELHITDMSFDDAPEPNPCPADLDGSGTVGVPDLLLLLAAWGANPGHAADLDNNGAVGVSDLLILLAAWGACR